MPKIISSSTHRFIHIAMRLSEIWFRTKFKDDIKSDILEQGTQKKMKDEKSSGLFGGQYPINSFEL